MHRMIARILLTIAIAMGAMRSIRAFAGQRPGERFVDVGIGICRVQPYVVGGAACASMGFTLARRTDSFWPRAELRAAAGRKLPTGNLEAAKVDFEALAGVLVGVDTGTLLPGSTYLAAGLGVGHAWITGARAPLRYLGVVDAHDLTGPAYGISLGFRAHDRSGKPGMQVTLRVDGIFRSLGASRAYATTLQFGHAL